MAERRRIFASGCFGFANDVVRRKAALSQAFAVGFAPNNRFIVVAAA
jgi:hypothetical protein